MIVGPILAVIVFLVAWRMTGSAWDGATWAGGVLGAAIGAFAGGFWGFLLGALIGAGLPYLVLIYGGMYLALKGFVFGVEAIGGVTGLSDGQILALAFYGSILIAVLFSPISRNDPESVYVKIRRRFTKGG